MVKNIPTIERSTKIRFGKYATNDQGENTIVFNASNAAIDTSVPGSIYMTPLRSEDIRNTDVKILTYNRTTKEVLDSNVTSDDIFSMNLEFVTNNDNVTSNTVRFINDTTAFVTTGNVGIHNTSPTHALDVGSNVYVTKDGEVRVGPSILINSSVTNKIQVSGRIDTDSITLDHIGLSNNNPTITGLSLGSSTFLQHPTDSINAFSTSGNVSAAFYHGDSYFLSNLNLNNIVLQGNTTASRTVQFNYANGPALITNGNVGIQNTHGIHTLDVGSNLFVDDIGSDILNVTGNVNATNYLKSKKLEVSEDAIISGNVNASGNIETTSGFFKGDGGILSNVTLQQVTDAGNTTSNTVQFTNAHTAFTTDLTSNVGVKLNQLANVTLETDITLANEQILVYDGSNWTNQNLNHTFLRVKAEEAIQKGNVVYVTSSTGNNTFNVRKANATDSLTMPAIGVAYENLAVNGEGLIVSFGRADGMLLDGFVEGETVYVSNVGDGLVSNVKPLASTDLIQNVGIVIKPHASSGIISVTGVGRSNDIPNAEEVYAQPTYVYVNSTGNELKKIDPTILNANNQTLDMVTSWSNSTQNTIQSTHATTGFISSGNVHVGSNIFISGLTDPTNNYLTMADKTTGDLIKSPAYVTAGGKYVIDAAEAEFTGNLTFTGNATTFSSNNVVIQDRIFGLGANNAVHNLDMGILMEHKDDGDYANVALIYHADEHRFSLGYTQNTFTDDHILHYQDPDHVITFDILGNTLVQNNLTVVHGDLTAITLNGNVVGDTANVITLNGNVVGDTANVITLNGNVVGNTANVIILNGNVVGDTANVITLNGNVVGNTANVITLNGNVVGNTANVITLNGNVVGDTANVITLNGNVVGNTANVITLNGNVFGNNVNVITLTGNVVGNTANVITLNGNVVGNTANVITLNGNVVGDTANVITLNGNVVGNTANVITLNGNVVGDTANVITLNGNVVGDTANVITLNGNVFGNNVDVITLTGNVVGDTANVITLNGNVVGNTANVITLNGNVVGNTANVITLNGNVVGDTANVITLNGNVVGNTANVITLNGNVVGNTANVITLNGNVVGNTANVITLNGNVVGNTANVITLNGNVVGNTANVITLNGNVVGNTANVITLYGNVVGNTANVITLNGNVVGNTANVITLNGNVVGNTANVITLNGNVVGNTANVITLNGNVVADNVVATNGMYGNILGSNTISASTINAVTINSNVVATNVYGTIAGSNTISASTIYVGSTYNPNGYDLRVEGDAEITGNLLVGGTTTTVNTENLVVKDPIIQLGDASASVDSGLLLARSSTPGNVYVGYAQTESEFVIGFTSNHAGESAITVKDGVNFKMNVYGNVEASYFFGDGSQLSGIQTATPTLASVVDEGNVTSNVVQFSNVTTGIEITSNIDFTNKITLKSTSGTKSNLFVVNAIQLDPTYDSEEKNNVLSYNTTTGEIYDSGGQGGSGSSFNNITEENANVLIGSNLTINTFGSNVLTVSGNVSADNITIGGLNVAASPFALDDVVSVYEGANVTANVLTLGGVVTNVVTANTITLANNLTVSGNTTSQNIKLTNTDITASVTSGTITVDAKEKTYGTSPLVVSTTDVSNLVFSNLITGAQIVIPILASGGAINISSAMTNVNFYAMTSDVSVTQDKHALMTLSNLYGNIYMNAIGFS